MTTKVQRNKGVGIGLASGVRTEDTSSSDISRALSSLGKRMESGTLIRGSYFFLDTSTYHSYISEKFLRKENDFSDVNSLRWRTRLSETMPHLIRINTHIGT
ncbi:hypothetical protein POM88_012938 [Heracleum sosnowskyi]|uniref:Uncharacterized protein n=1 Tax=Heracleum sosnowskyi TaxID=360622 RepID=A0AAD8J0V7_9APIA|nr:hypothetical protein POM88_012938 [Heracleum sosnowskyi]